jgi:hypothetical protein
MFIAASSDPQPWRRLISIKLDFRPEWSTLEESAVRGSYLFPQGCRISQPDLDIAWLFRVFPSRVGAGKAVKIACLAPLVALR